MRLYNAALSVHQSPDRFIQSTDLLESWESTGALPKSYFQVTEGSAIKIRCQLSQGFQLLWRSSIPSILSLKASDLNDERILYKCDLTRMYKTNRRVAYLSSYPGLQLTASGGSVDSRHAERLFFLVSHCNAYNLSQVCWTNNYQYTYWHSLP